MIAVEVEVELETCQFGAHDLVCHEVLDVFRLVPR